MGPTCGCVLLTISLDIANTFNSLLFSCIKEALHYLWHSTLYSGTLAGTMEECTVMYEDRDCVLRHRIMWCGIPQGSILGSLLWNMDCDWVLWEHLPSRLCVSWALVLLKKPTTSYKLQQWNNNALLYRTSCI